MSASPPTPDVWLRRSEPTLRARRRHPATVCGRPLSRRQRVGSVLFPVLMRRLRQFVRTQSRGGLLAVYVAYSLALQATMASIGLGMSVSTAPDRVGFVLCGVTSHRTAPASGDRHTPAPAPQCPFCFVAAQSTGHVATTGEAPAFPAYACVPIAAISHPIGDGTFVSQFRHRNGEPRAPPAFSA
jgi:hypothetical protein